jgi:hypothetical protein
MVSSFISIFGILLVTWFTPSLSQNPVSHTFAIHVNASDNGIQTSGFVIPAGRITNYTLLAVTTSISGLNNTYNEIADIAVSVVIGDEPNTVIPRTLNDLIPPLSPGDKSSTDRIDPCGHSILINPNESGINVYITVSSNVTFVMGSVNVQVQFLPTLKIIPGNFAVDTADSNNVYVTLALANPENASAIEITLRSGSNQLKQVFPQLISASGDFCPASGPNDTPNRVITDLPEQQNFTFTLGSQKVWYLEFIKTTETLAIIDVEVATKPPNPPAPEPGANNTGIIVGVTITIVIVVAGVAIVVYKRKGAYQNIG